MPRRRSQSTVRALVLGIVGVLLGVALLVGLSLAAGHGQVKFSNLGAHEFRAGRTDSLTNAIKRDGPLLFADALGKTRDIYVQHLGSKWYAIAAGKRTCTLKWSGKDFTDPCSSTTYPADGSGLTRYRTRVDGNVLYVDFTSTVP